MQAPRASWTRRWSAVWPERFRVRASGAGQGAGGFAWPVPGAWPRCAGLPSVLGFLAARRNSLRSRRLRVARCAQTGRRENEGGVALRATARNPVRLGCAQGAGQAKPPAPWPATLCHLTETHPGTAAIRLPMASTLPARRRLSCRPAARAARPCCRVRFAAESSSLPSQVCRRVRLRSCSLVVPRPLCVRSQATVCQDAGRGFRRPPCAQPRSAVLVACARSAHQQSDLPPPI